MSLRFSFSKHWAVVFAAFALLAAPAAASANGYNDAVLADGPLAYYELNETSGTTAFDSTSNHVDGTYSGTFTLGAGGPFSMAGSAVSFNGGGSVDASLAGTVHTAELWVKPSVKNAQMSFVTHGDPSADGWTVGIGARRKLVFKTSGRTVNSRFPVGFNRWTMIDVSWNSTSVSFALNGGQTQFKSKLLPVAAPGPASNTALVIGDGPLGAVKGAVDEVALYPTALTRTDIGGHYAATGLPVNTALPVVTGVPRVGETLTVTPGAWTDSNSTSEQWQQCDPSTGDCTDIAGATGLSLTLDNGELGKQIQVVETATNGVGSSSVTSNQTAAVVDVEPAGGPVNLTVPTISGDAVEGHTLTADPGTWDPASGLTFAYQWQRCDVDGENCSPIDGATALSYVLGSADVGSTVDVVVTASDGTHTSDPAESDPTAVVTTASATDGGSGSGTNGGGGTGTGGTSGSPAATGAVLGTQVACPARLLSIPKRVSKRHRGIGKLVLRFKRGSGTSALKATLKLNRRLVRSVEFRLGTKRVKRLRHAPFGASIPKRLLQPGATQTLKVIFTPRHGRKFILKVRLHVAACS